jgi:hypothetical protein
VRDRAWPERHVYEGVEVEDALALRLRVTAADGDDELRVHALPGSHVAEVRREPRVGLLADRAGVEHHDVRILGRRRLAETQRLEHALDPLRVVGVHLTAERGDVVALHRATILPGVEMVDATRSSTPGRKLGVLGPKLVRFRNPRERISEPWRNLGRVDSPVPRHR